MGEVRENNSGFKTNFFKNVLVSGGYNYLSQGLTFLSTIITARLLSPENYGLVGLITVFTGFISVFADSGISLAVIKSDYGFSYHKALDNLSVIIGIALFSITCVLAYPIAYFYGNQELLWPTVLLGSTFVFKSMGIVRSALLSKSLNFAYLGKGLLISTIITITLTIILAYFGAQHWAIIIPQIVSAIFLFVFYELRLKFGFSIYPFPFIKVAFMHTRSVIGSLLGFNLVNYWSRNSDNLIVGKVYGVNDLGIYNRGYSLLTLPLTLISGLMGTVLYPSLKKLKSEGGDIFKEYMFVLKVISFIVYPIAFVLIMFPFDLVLLLWGETWRKVGTLLPYFGLLIFSQALLSTTGNILVLQGKEKALMLSGWVGAFFMILGICYGALSSIVAIAQFYSLAFIICVLPFNVFYVFYRSLNFNLKELLPFWIPIIVVSFCIWGACFYNLQGIKLGMLLVLLVVCLVNARSEIFNVSAKVRRWRLSRLNS